MTNLLVDSWVPVEDGQSTAYSSLKEILCSEKDFKIRYPFDSIEMAALQILIGMTQYAFHPKTLEEIQERLKEPMDPDEFDERVTTLQEYFDLFHPVHPCFQTASVPEKGSMSLGKFIPGMPGVVESGGDQHTFFNGTDEFNKFCPACAAVCLYNRSVNAPSIGSKHKGGLRGGSAITSLVKGKDLRETIWLNVIPKETSDQIFSGDDEFTWVTPPPHGGGTVFAGQIGLNRGLFWIQLRAKFDTAERKEVCDLCGKTTPRPVVGIFVESNVVSKKESKTFGSFKLEGVWPHPHSPRSLLYKKGKDGKFSQPDEYFFRFYETVPAWNGIAGMIVEHEIERGDTKTVYCPSLTASQYPLLCPGEPLTVVVGGYVSANSTFKERRHEIYSVNESFVSGNGHLHGIIHDAVSVKDLLSKAISGALYPLGKSLGSSKQEAVRRFYRTTMSDVLYALGSMDVESEDFRQRRNAFVKRLNSTAEEIFSSFTDSYRYRERTGPSVCRWRRKLRKNLSELIKEDENE